MGRPIPQPMPPARLAAVRAALGGGAALPAPVWEDATSQLAGMLQALATLQEDVPALAPPGAAPPAPPRREPGAPGMSAGAPARMQAGAPAGGLCALSLTDLAGRLRRREVSPVEVTRAVARPHRRPRGRPAHLHHPHP